MIVESVHIHRGNYGYSAVKPSDPFKCSLKVAGEYGKVELQLSPALSQRIVEIVADEIAAAGRATAEALTADVLNVKALPSAEAA